MAGVERFKSNTSANVIQVAAKHCDGGSNVLAATPLLARQKGFALAK
jgi:hypothetical protein